MIIDYVYEQLRNDSVCESAYKFSREFLGRSSSYYSVLKAQKREPSNTVLLTLEIALKKRAELYVNPRYPFIIRTRNHLLEMHEAVKKYREQQILMRFITYKQTKNIN